MRELEGCRCRRARGDPIGHFTVPQFHETDERSRCTAATVVTSPLLALPASAVGATPANDSARAVSASGSFARPSDTYQNLCYSSLRSLKTLRPSSSRTYSYDALTLQEALVYLDFPPPVPIKMDGWYGPATASAVKAYQQSRRLYVDGIVGQQTWRQLRSEIC